jgi:asparagine synthase (glutamine-hydrolysing)
MCGIAGYVDFNAGATDIELLWEMTRRLRRRGPDANGVLSRGPCGLAHTRLSIIDPEGGAQPMDFPPSPLSLVYNGEIYNFQACRKHLQRQGHVFETASDTEVLYRGLEWRWRDILPHLEGMFAFGAWDRRRGALLLARDPIGEKPLFYAAPAPGVLVFASEIKAVLAHPAVDRAIDADALREVLRFGALYGARSLHRGVRQLEPGCFLQFDRSGLESGRYFDLIAESARSAPRLARLADRALVGEGRAMFMRAVERRLAADAPVGAFLSGGLDSSLVAAAMRKLRGPGEAPHTFSVGFRGDPHSELGFARTVADSIGSRHHALVVGPEDFLRRWVELSAHRDSPLGEPAEIAVAELSRLARRWVKVVLSGDGADETFGGYPKYALANAPGVLRAGLRILGADNAGRLARLVGIRPSRAVIACRAIAQTRELDRMLEWFSDGRRRELRALLPGLDWSEEAWSRTMTAQADALARIEVGSPMARMQIVDCLTWLPGNMLEQADRMTMAEGLELRAPFLDRDLVAFALALPDRLKVRIGSRKWMVRQWGRGLLPTRILWRRKWGFRVPLDAWFRGPLKAMLLAYTLDGDGFCASHGDKAAIERLIRRQLSGEADRSRLLFTLLSTEIWYRHVYRPGRREAAENRADDRSWTLETR